MFRTLSDGVNHDDISRKMEPGSVTAVASTGITNTGNINNTGNFTQTGDITNTGSLTNTGAISLDGVGGIIDSATADGTINAKRLSYIDGSGDLVEADVNTVGIAGVNAGATKNVGETMTLGLIGKFTGQADAKIEGGKFLKSCSGGRIGRAIDSGLAGTTMKTQAAAGGAFGNQPANDGVTLVSDNAADVSITVRVWGTTNGTDTLISEDIVTDATDGTTPVNSVKVDWGLILGFEVTDGAHAGTLTLSETSDGLAIKTLATGSTTSGILEVDAANQRAFNKAPTLVSDNATTKQIGLVGTSTAYAALLDSQALNGTTEVTMNSAFNTVTRILVGDLEAARTVTLAVGAQDSWDLIVGKSDQDGAAAKDNDCIFTIGG